MTVPTTARVTYEEGEQGSGLAHFTAGTRDQCHTRAGGHINAHVGSPLTFTLPQTITHNLNMRSVHGSSK